MARQARPRRRLHEPPALCIPGSPWVGRDHSVPQQPTLEGTWHRVPDGPGRGVELNEEAVEQQTFEFWEARHLHRRDGSHTNW